MFAKLCSAILWLRNLLSLISFILYQSYIYQSYISHISVIYQSYISHISVIYQSYISHMSVIFQSYISPISVIYQLLPQRTFWSQTICTFLHVHREMSTRSEQIYLLLDFLGKFVRLMLAVVVVVDLAVDLKVLVHPSPFK